MPIDLLRHLPIDGEALRQEGERLANEAERLYANILLRGSSRSVLPGVAFLDLKVVSPQRCGDSLRLTSAQGAGGTLRVAGVGERWIADPRRDSETPLWWQRHMPASRSLRARCPGRSLRSSPCSPFQLPRIPHHVTGQRRKIQLGTV